MTTLRETNTAQSFVAVTPSDTVAITGGPVRGLFVGVAGDVVVIGLDGAAATFKNVPNGSVLPVACVRVNNTSTTATNILGLF